MANFRGYVQNGKNWVGAYSGEERLGDICIGDSGASEFWPHSSVMALSRHDLSKISEAMAQFEADELS